jgi:hypothetical protein
MSLCYDFQKWIIISFTAMAITLIIGLVGLVYGQNQSQCNGQCQPLPPSLLLKLCTAFKSEHLVILDSDDACGENAGAMVNALNYYVTQGYEIKSVIIKNIG